MKQKKWRYLDEYVQSYKEHDGYSEIPGYLPKLVVYFRMALDALNTEPAEFFGWDEETAEDFLTWGHNSRWNHTFSIMLENNLEEYVDLLKNAMIENEIDDFEVVIPKQED